MNTIIHFIRHAANPNPDGIIPGRMAGFHLDNAGKKQAKKVGEFLKDHPIKAIYTSPLERTFETANVISDFFPKAKITHAYDLIEVESTHWQSLKVENLYLNDYYETFINDPETKEVSENLNGLAERMKKFTFNLCNEHKGEEVICVSHMCPIVALKLSLEGKSLQLVKTTNLPTASITSFYFDETFKFVKVEYNETPR
jgi:broad specificity phosphatase PhoE